MRFGIVPLREKRNASIAFFYIDMTVNRLTATKGPAQNIGGRLISIGRQI